MQLDEKYIYSMYNRIRKTGATTMTIGERIQKKRKEAGLSQEELGAKLNVSRQAVYKWENDQPVFT